MSDYLQHRRNQKLGLVKKEDKKPKPIPKVSKKKLAEIAAAKSEKKKDPLDQWFEEMRKNMVGVCQCGCARSSSKHENDNYKSSIAHIFPKRLFKSIATNDLNWVERNFWDGCHTNMDNRSVEKWPMFADWDDIKEKFHKLSPILTEKEKSFKFYKHLEKLINEK